MNAEERKEYQREWRIKNRKHIQEERIKYRENNREHMNEVARIWRANNKEKFKEMNRLHRIKNHYRYWARGVLLGHKNRGNIINITLDELIDLAKKTNTCLYCNDVLDYERDKGIHDTTASIDRKDNGNELSLENINIICYKCNATKRSRTHKEFIEYCKIIVNKFGDTND